MMKTRFGQLFLIFAILLILLSACDVIGLIADEGEPSHEEAPSTMEPHQVQEEESAPPPPSVGWTDHASTRIEMSISHPGDWLGLADLPEGEGAYIKHPDQDMAFIMTFRPTKDIAALLDAWGSEPVGIPMLLEVTIASTGPADPVTVSRIQAPSLIGHNQGLMAQVAFVARPDDTLELLWIAPEDQWDASQGIFAGILASIEVWQRYFDEATSLQTMVLHDWAEPTTPWTGEGVWFHSADQASGVVIFTEPLDDPQARFNAWDPIELGGIGFAGNCPSELMGEVDRLRAIGGRWETLGGECERDSTGPTRYRMAYAADGDRLLRIIIYAPVEDWDYAFSIFETMLGLLSSLR